MKWLDCTNMPPEPQAGSKTIPWSGSMTLTMVCTIEGGVKNSPLSCAPCLENSARKYFVDTTEHVAGRVAQSFLIEQAEHPLQDIVLEPFVVLRQLPGERRKCGLH